MQIQPVINRISPIYGSNIQKTFAPSFKRRLNRDVFIKQKDLGTEENPIKIDFSSKIGKKAKNVFRPYKLEKYYEICENKPTYDTTQNDLISNVSIEAFEVYEGELRHMQWNGGKLTKEFYAKCKKEYKKADKLLYPDFESYFEAKREKVLKLFEEQESDLEKVKPTKKDNYFWRGLNLCEKDGSNAEIFGPKVEDQQKFSQYIEECAPGDIITPDWAAMCASTNLWVTSFFCGNTLLRIKAPKGSRLFNMGMENEVRFPSKSQFKVLNKTDYDGLKIIELEYVVPKKAKKGLL